VWFFRQQRGFPAYQPPIVGEHLQKTQPAPFVSSIAKCFKFGLICVRSRRCAEMEEQHGLLTDNNQDKSQESGNEINTQDSAVDIEKRGIALSVLKEAIISAGIKDFSEYKGEPLNLRWHLFYQASDEDVLLKIAIRGLFGSLNANFSLIGTAERIVDEVEEILTKPDATRILDFSIEERPELLRDNARMILTKYINQIPIVAFQSLNQSLNDAFKAHVKTYVEPLLKEHWKSLGLPKKFTVDPSETLTTYFISIDEQFNVLRQELLGNKKVRLTDEKRANLGIEHEELRSQYQVAKDYYNQSRKAFFLGKRNRTEDEWADEWITQSFRMFPALPYHCRAEINSYAPFELAYMHLADFYDIGSEYVRKLVTQASRLRDSKR
jgi:hypothetical protein